MVTCKVYTFFAITTSVLGLSVPLIGVNAFETAKKAVDKVVCIRLVLKINYDDYQLNLNNYKHSSEEYLTLAILRLIEVEKAVVEGAGAVGLAALLQGLLPELGGKK